jgi:hypothetical protein
LAVGGRGRAGRSSVVKEQVVWLVRVAGHLGAMPLSLGHSMQVNGWWPVVCGSGVRGAFDAVGVVPGSFDDTRVGTVSAFVQFLEHLGERDVECPVSTLRGKNPPGR